MNISMVRKLISAGDQFLMIGDKRDPATEPGMVARYLLQRAERIFVLGFDFHQANVELLNLDDSKLAEKLVVLNWDGSVRLRRKLDAIGVRESNIWSGTSTSHYSIAKAIDDGIFDVHPGII